MAQNYAHFTVSGKHRSPEYAAKTYTIDVHYSDNEHGFFCTNDELGCSRTYQVFDASTAVSKFMSEHGYFLMRIREITPKEV